MRSALFVLLGPISPLGLLTVSLFLTMVFIASEMALGNGPEDPVLLLV
jgi:hypothetical protein